MYKLKKESSIISAKVDGVRRSFNKDNISLLPEKEYERLKVHDIVQSIKAKNESGAKTKDKES
ncbi:MAG: hypothetical protein R3250_04590 [Melioribacteraceae bacterium]|nr:hypothetical protein [Melioribacteraceae bacterium]